jgi:DNA primase catalytic core
MPRIKDETLRRVKTEIDLVGLIKAEGVELTKKGKDLVGLCPFHDDIEPSLVVTPKKNLWHCLGACGIGGGVIDWTMKTRGVTFTEAVTILAEKLTNKSPSAVVANLTSQSDSHPNPSPQLEIPAIPKDQKLLKRVISYYQDRLKETPEALSYLEKRGLVHPELIETFQVGYCDRSLASILPKAGSEEGKKIRQRLKESGLYKPAGGHELFNGCLTFPITDPEGTITEIYGRRIKEDRRLTSHLYLPGPHKGVLNPEAFRGRELILCESVIDALSFWVHGFENVTALYGTEGFSTDHKELIRSQGIKRIILALDNDEAGNRAALRIGKELFEIGPEPFKIHLPQGLDINEVLLLQKDPEKRRQALKKLLGNAERMPFKSPASQQKAAKKESERLASDLPSLAAETPECNPTPVESDRNVNSVKFSADPGATFDTGKEATDRKPEKPLDSEPEVKGEEIFTRFGPRQYRIRGLFKNLSFEVLRVNIRVSLGDPYHLDTLDLYQAKARNHYIKEAAEELGIKETVIKTDLGKMLLKLEELQVEAIEKKLKPEEKEIVLSPAQETEALDFLRSKDLVKRIGEDFKTCGMVGEEANCLAGYLAATSRKLDKPLAVMIQSSSAAGKSTLMDAVLQFMPEEEQLRFTAMTGQSLFYMGEEELVHKILAISEGEGAERATYALKTLQSEGKLKIASTSKDPKTGRLETQSYDVKGPTQMFATTTLEIDEELQNRNLILTVDESEKQTQAIQQAQRLEETFLGLQADKRKERLIVLHQNAQRLLKAVPVINPYAHHLTFPSHLLRLRRDNKKYLTLIRTITLLYQYQRETKESFLGIKTGGHIESTIDDILLANALCEEIFKRSLDELTPQTRRCLTVISELVESTSEKEAITPLEVRFTRKALREFSGFSDFQVRTHLRRLVDLEYLFIEQGAFGQRFVYGQLYSAKDEKDKPSFMGLIDRKTLEKKIVAEKKKDPSGKHLSKP